MKNLIKLSFLVLFAGVLAVPSVSSAATVADLQAQLNSLLAQVRQLQQQLSQIQEQPVIWCHDFNVNLEIGDSGSEVSALTLALEKEGLINKTTDNFDEIVASAISSFQLKYKDEILIPLGLKYGTGFVSEKTREKLNSLYGCAMSLTPISSSSTAHIQYNQPFLPSAVSPYACSRCSDYYNYVWADFQSSTVDCNNPVSGTVKYACNCGCGAGKSSDFGNCLSQCVVASSSASTSAPAPPPTAISAPYQNSPFGIQAPFCLPPFCEPQPTGYSNSKIVAYLSDIGAKWVRLIEPELNEVKDLLLENKINILAGLGANVVSEATIKTLARKYKDQVKYWLLVNEAETGWQGAVEEYVAYFTSAAKAIKAECPDCKIILSLAGGQVVNGELAGKGQNFFDLVLKNGVGSYFDVLDFHVQGAAGEYKDLKIKVNAYKAILEKYGIKDKPIWITEYGTYDNDPTPDNSRQPDYSLQTESQQAAELIKKYIYGISLGVDKMFWTTMEEWYKYNGNVNSYFSNVGLVNNPLNDGNSHKKLAYYVYKKMAEILEGSEWNNIRTIRESDGIYIYKFIKDNKPIWAAWNDNNDSRRITISGISLNNVKIIEAIPKYKSGKEVTDYNTAFNIETQSAQNGNITMILSDTPVFIYENTSPDTISPAISIISPVNNATASGTINVNADASDNVGVSKVEFYVDNALKSTNVSSPYSFALDTKQLADGLHAILAKAYDAANNNTQHSIVLNVNNVIPLPACSLDFSPSVITLGQTVVYTVHYTNDVDGQISYSCAGDIGSGALTGGPLGSGDYSGALGGFIPEKRGFYPPTQTQACALIAKNSAGQTASCSAVITVNSVSNPGGVCGDRICDARERANPNLCPMDCR